MNLAFHNAWIQVSLYLVGAGSVPKLNPRVNKPWSLIESLAWEITIDVSYPFLRFHMGAPLTRNRIFLLLVHKKVAENGIDLKKEAEKMKDDFRMKQTEKWFLGRNTKSNLWSVNSHLLSCGETTWRRQELLLEKEHALVRKTIKKQEERSQKSLNRKHLGFKSYLGTHGPTFDSCCHQEWGWSVLSSGPSNTKNGPRNIQ